MTDDDVSADGGDFAAAAEHPSELPGPNLRQATVGDVDRLKAVLADAFFADPIFGWLMPDETKRSARLRRYFAIELRHFALARGRVWTTTDLAGAALSLPPDTWRAPLRATLLEGGAFGVHLPRAATLAAAIERRHVREHHYYVRDVGVSPAMQSRGLGSAMLAPTLSRCDREGVPAYLEASSERNAALYARLGFELIDELRVNGSPPLRLMLRPPDRGGARP
ncbi:MAG TPA: GNAT family N-acetyltransferase [Solirubrobacteraceae bacterium]|nr:GNAT family N-acetyltransferase [Solirubrobacteraceae bacterium]